MRSIVVVIALVLAACMQQQHNGTDISNLECVSCHLADFQKANALDSTHTNQDCAQCHDTSSWNAGHPESKFPISTGAHVSIACKTCHSESGAYVAGANTNCIQCHPQTQTDPQHVGTSGYAYSNTVKNFCLTCHPDGKAAGHPEAKFPIASGAHSGIACATCHSEPGAFAAGANTNCIQCHPDTANLENNHSQVGNFMYSTTQKNFCLTCHPTGRAGN